MQSFTSHALQQERPGQYEEEICCVDTIKQLWSQRSGKETCDDEVIYGCGSRPGTYVSSSVVWFEA